MTSHTTSIAILRETEYRNKYNTAIQSTYTKYLINNRGTKSFDKWFKPVILDWYRRGHCCFEGHEEGTQKFYRAIVCFEHLLRLHPNKTFPEEPTPWFRNRRLNRFLRKEGYSILRGPEMPRKVQVAKGQTRLFDVSECEGMGLSSVDESEIESEIETESEIEAGAEAEVLQGGSARSDRISLRMVAGPIHGLYILRIVPPPGFPFCRFRTTITDADMAQSGTPPENSETTETID